MNIQTYAPDSEQDALILDFIKALEAAGGTAPEQRAALVAANGERIELPEALHRVLIDVADALASGMGVAVAPMNAMLTTQEAADFLGIARPTLVRILDRGEIPMERPGRHRFVRLQDLVDYQERDRARRRTALEEMVRDAEADRLYEVTDGPPPATR
ncbi:helix-turn-helix domain-containing protein [Nocardioides speluncae]|uniref:helix-turn-helix domain-containing protein n=1 Tax=Nocardioides speluncae TaxID=2670337 RepID=UPI00197F344D|nr:helix-turn-helix domain-containing protein [Nocardioides speluncae]